MKVKSIEIPERVSLPVTWNKEVDDGEISYDVVDAKGYLICVTHHEHWARYIASNFNAKCSN